MQGEEQRGTLGTVRNATLLLSLLAEGPAYNQLTDLAERSAMSLPTVHRLLRSLALDGRSRPSNRDRRAWADAPFLLLGPDGDRPMTEVAVPVVDGSGRALAALCARGDPAAFTDEVLRTEVTPQLVRAARAAGRAMA